MNGLFPSVVVLFACVLSFDTMSQVLQNVFKQRAKWIIMDIIGIINGSVQCECARSQLSSESLLLPLKHGCYQRCFVHLEIFHSIPNDTQSFSLPNVFPKVFFCLIHLCQALPKSLAFTETLYCFKFNWAAARGNSFIESSHRTMDWLDRK